MPRKARALKSSSRVQRLPMTQARAHLGDLVNRVHDNKEYFILEKDGIPIAGLMDIEEFEDYLELRDPKVQAHIRKSHQEVVAGKSRPAEALLAELQRGKKTKTT
ncbi:MAG: type II toxin-antitoxin system Phd/YefM family antitoxin [Candidatus Latescibacteria bacterium]|nr:type II toxin-antitoxin system Phd/YefM family antitoxin [Candidatus Latescibacterota bacterium]